MEVGLCASCKHSRAISGKQSTFWMCELSRTDPSFPRYPRLPVLRCRGYEPKSDPDLPSPPLRGGAPRVAGSPGEVN
ncbi:MAG TPA: hypothetical protein DCF65_06060 [Chloroflexi bacterium]|nr:hypothetical protein [Chloroflexota bacterium]HAF19952.1 hypothetical protein [Chloroflexota bacterium]